MTRYWFRPKRYGYGATPNTWQGWALTVATVLVILAASLSVTALGGKSLWSLAALLAIDAVVVVSYRKTDGGWHWRWGDR